jgi:hypothetical protein
MVVIGVDGGIGAMAFRFGCERVYQPAADEAAHGRQKKEDPAIERPGRGGKQVMFACR